MLLVVVVLVSMHLVEGNGPHKFDGLFALGGANLAMFSLLILDFPLFCVLFLDLLEKGLLLVKGFEWNGLFLSFFSSSHVSIFLCKDANGFIHLLQGLQVAVSTVWSFLNVWIPWTSFIVSSTSIVSMGRVHQRNLKTKSQTGFISQAIVCKNIYAGFIQFLWGIIGSQCEPIEALS